jgi:hypothetical protein
VRHRASSDIALFLLTASQPGTDPVAQSDQPGSSEVLSLRGGSLGAIWLVPGLGEQLPAAGQ